MVSLQHVSVYSSGRPRRTYTYGTSGWVLRTIRSFSWEDDEWNPSIIFSLFQGRGYKILTTTVSPLPNETRPPAKVTTPCPDTFTKGDRDMASSTWLRSVSWGSSCPVPPENSKTPSPVKAAFVPKTKPPSLSHRWNAVRGGRVVLA